jgi:hypothetical protein
MTFTRKRFVGPLGSLVLTVAAMAAGTAAHAQPAAGDPPGRVARLSDLNGQVWMYSPDTAEWVSAERNRPLTSGDRLATDPGARAELQMGSTTLRLDASTELEVVELDDDHMSLQLHGGSISARLRNATDAGEFDVTTEDGRFVFQRAGRYRIDRVKPASHLTVFAGQAVYEGPGSALTVNAGQRAEFWLDSSNAAQYSLSSPVKDEFAAWISDRDRGADRVAVPRYVSPEMTGVEDLDRYGSWEQNNDYGSLWIPRGVAVGWAPYSTGHWAYVLPWGWTWVDDAPWGFAPFHYGRWVYYRNSWCWTPGARVARPVYAPALVAWVGGPRVSVSVTVGAGPAVGWFPLAPREVYVPSYRVTPRYVQNINITHVTNVTTITNVYNNPQAPREFYNRRLPNALTVVPTAVLASRQPVAPAAAQLRSQPWVRELNNQPRQGETMVAPPVVAPIAPRAERRPVSPPPGVGGAPRAPRDAATLPRTGEVGRPSVQGNEPSRGGGGERRPGLRDEGGRSDNTPPRPAGSVTVAPTAPTAVTPTAPMVTGPAVPRPVTESPGRRPGSGAGDDRRGPAREQIPPPSTSPAAAPAQAPTPVAPAVAPARPQAPPPQPGAPVTRPTSPREAERPVVQPPPAEPQGRRAPPAQPLGEDRRPAPRGEAAPVPRAPQRVEPAAPVKPAEPPAQAKPAAVPKQEGPDARRPEAPARARAEAVKDNERRGDGRGDRSDKKD